VYVGPPRDPDTVALLGAATPVTSRTDFQVISAQRITAGDLTYITLEVKVSNKTGSDLTNLSILGYSSKRVSFSDSAVTRYVQRETGSNATGAARVTPFLFATSGNPAASFSDATLGTTLYSETDAAFTGLANLLQAAPYRDIAAELFPYGFVANPEGDRTIVDHGAGTLYLSFRVAADTIEIGWRGVIVQDPTIRLGLPVSVSDTAGFLQRLVNLSVSNSDKPVRGVVIGNVDNQPGQRVIEVRHNTFNDRSNLRDAFAAGRYRVDAIPDVKLSVGSANSNYWLQTPTAAPTDVYLLERFTDTNPASPLAFEAPIPSGSTSLLVEHLIVAGGGGGGNTQSASSTPGGGGGAGGLLLGSSRIDGGSTVSVGAGGSAAPNSTIGQGSNGSNSSALNIEAIGGGGGGGFAPNATGLSGGSGGGGAGTVSANQPGGTGREGQGFRGGSGTHTAAAGGGGAGGPGVDAPSQGVNGSAGPGVELHITGETVEYAKGGEPGNQSSGFKGVNGSNGLGEGGQGSGWGASASAGNGGSGVVIIRYSLAQP
jgi:hypothetical protein